MSKTVTMSMDEYNDLMKHKEVVEKKKSIRLSGNMYGWDYITVLSDNDTIILLEDKIRLLKEELNNIVKPKWYQIWK